MKLRKIYSIIGFMTLMVVSACHNEKEYIGPGYVSAPEGFGISDFRVSSASINFANDPEGVSFNAEYTNSVSWILTITGNTSGAQHVIKGSSKGLNNIGWKGNHDGVAFFRTGEVATAILSFYGSSLTSKVEVQILGAPNYQDKGYFPSNGDFETASAITPGNGWHPFNNPPIPNVIQGVGSNIKNYAGEIVPAIEGVSYYYIKGKGDQPQFVSGIQYTGYSSQVPKLPADANQVWVNMYIYGTGDANASVDIEYQESDNDGDPNFYDRTNDDAFVAHVTLNHTGWKLFSFKYSDLVPSTNVGYGDNGNHIHEPQSLQSFDLVLLKKSNPESPVEVYFDFPIITIGGPFKPTL